MNKLAMKIKADVTEINKQMERSAKILADAAKKSQLSIISMSKAFAKISPIDYNKPMPSFSSRTADNPRYWKQLQKEMNQMNYENLKRDDTIYHCVVDGETEYLIRFIGDENKQIINYHTGRIINNSTAIYGNNRTNYRLANLEERCRFYNIFGYRDAKGRVWKIGDNDSNGDEILKFSLGSETWKKDRVWAQTEIEGDPEGGGSVYWMDTYCGEFPVKDSTSSIGNIQKSPDVAQELTNIDIKSLLQMFESGRLSINEARELLGLPPIKVAKVSWFKKALRWLV